jgi:hypothetical protein
MIRSFVRIRYRKGRARGDPSTGSKEREEHPMYIRTHKARRFGSLLLMAALVIGMASVVPLGCQEIHGRVGLKTGAINTGVDSEVEAFLNTDWRTGFTAGGFVSLDPTSHLNLHMDVLFSQRGFGFRVFDEAMGLIPGEATARTLEIHVDLGLRLPWGSERIGSRIFAGPALGYELSCRVNGSAMGMAFSQECHEPLIGLRTQNLDLGFSFGGGVDISLDPVALVVDARYAHGFRNLNKDGGSTNHLRSRAWTFTVGLGWPF